MILGKGFDVVVVGPQKALDVGSLAVPTPNPDHFRRKAKQETQVAEVGVFGHNQKIVLSGIFADGGVISLIESYQVNVAGVRKEIVQALNQTGRQVVIEEQFHAGTTMRLFSRSAA